MFMQVDNEKLHDPVSWMELDLETIYSVFYIDCYRAVQQAHACTVSSHILTLELEIDPKCINLFGPGDAFIPSMSQVITEGMVSCMFEPILVVNWTLATSSKQESNYKHFFHETIFPNALYKMC